jgi:hypothetical protein
MRIFTTKTNCIKTVLAFMAALFYLNTLSKTGIAKAFLHVIMWDDCKKYATGNLTPARFNVIYHPAYKKLCL